MSTLLPTPTREGNRNRKGLSAKSGDGLQTAVGGTLHPRFVEWMMGLPSDWTRAEMTLAEAKAKRTFEAAKRKSSKRRTVGASERSETPSSSKSPK